MNDEGNRLLERDIVSAFEIQVIRVGIGIPKNRHIYLLIFRPQRQPHRSNWREESHAVVEIHEFFSTSRQYLFKDRSINIEVFQRHSSCRSESQYL